MVEVEVSMVVWDGVALTIVLLLVAWCPVSIVIVSMVSAVVVIVLVLNVMVIVVMIIMICCVSVGSIHNNNK